MLPVAKIEVKLKLFVAPEDGAAMRREATDVGNRRYSQNKKTIYYNETNMGWPRSRDGRDWFSMRLAGAGTALPTKIMARHY